MPWIDAFFNNSRLRRAWLKVRWGVGTGFLLLWFCLAEVEWLWLGFAVSLFGEAIQLWCFATLDKRNTLAFNGLYKFIRNPMYLGRYFLVVGYLLLLWPKITIPAATLLYGFYMRNRIKREEATLRRTFGAAYDEYVSRVPPYVPRNSGMTGGVLWTWSWRLWRQNHGPENLGFMLGTFLLLFLRAVLLPLHG